MLGVLALPMKGGEVVSAPVELAEGPVHLEGFDAGVGMTSMPDAEGVSVSDDGSDVLDVMEPAIFSRPRTLIYSAYRVQPADMIGVLAENMGLNQDTLIDVNNISNPRTLQIGAALKIPNQDGVYYKMKKDDTLESVARANNTTAEAIVWTNELVSSAVKPGDQIFIPGAKLDYTKLAEINGDLFTWPLRGYRYVTSNYGYRSNPFGGGGRQFHTGLDIGAPTGTPIYSAMGGRVTFSGYSENNGNYVVISHHSGYRSMYAHMSKRRVSTGDIVYAGQRIGDVGSTGKSTGPHLHFMVYKNGRTINPRTVTN
jgi:murein DD-endopeptidase MepM/ murein hydrolase activator NlpD